MNEPTTTRVGRVPRARLLLGLVLAGALATGGRAQQPPPTAEPVGSGEAVQAGGEVVESPSSGEARDRPEPPSERERAAAPWWRKLKSTASQDGEVVLALATGSRTLHAGDVLEDTTVKTAAEGLLVLTRPAAADGSQPAATIIIRFDERGQGQAVLLFDRPPAARPGEGH